MPITIINPTTKTPLFCRCGHERIYLTRSHNPDYFAVWRCCLCGRIRKHISRLGAEVAR
ncbi:MAG: hypothetical protein AAF630_00635 [Cyanobacteria bacterium P01_C01_bin.38]